MIWKVQRDGVRLSGEAILNFVALDFETANADLSREIDRTYVSRLERGLENPTVAVLKRIASALSARFVLSIWNKQSRHS